MNLRKTLAALGIGFAAVAVGAAIASEVSAGTVSYGDEQLASAIYQTYHPHDYGKSVYRRLLDKIDSVKDKIWDNESDIKALEDKRLDLDHDLAVLLQNEEFYDLHYMYYELYVCRAKIREKEAEINRNERNINDLKRRRSDLDHDLAVLLQQKELYM